MAKQGKQPKPAKPAAPAPARVGMIDFTEVPFDTDGWELFARDFLIEQGFHIESPPNRGPDQGKDLLVTEQLKGRVGNYRMRWLVSCKHHATSKKAVSEEHEPNILDRLRSFRADGFIGFYSTVLSSGLSFRLEALRNQQDIKDYSIFDQARIENTLVTVGCSHLMMRYFPASYQRVKPLHLIGAQYRPLKCEVCEKDLLLEMFRGDYRAIIVYYWKDAGKPGVTHYEDVVCVCKGDCDHEFERRARQRKLITSWNDLTGLVIPIEFLRFCFATMNRLRAGNDVYSDAAYRKEIDILAALAQKVLRHTTAKERERYVQLQSLPPGAFG